MQHRNENCISWPVMHSSTVSVPLWLSPPCSRSLSPSDLILSLFSSLPLSFCLSPPAGWLARSSWCPRRSLTSSEHHPRVKLKFYFITHIETPAVLNVSQSVNAAQPRKTTKTSPAPARQGKIWQFSVWHWKRRWCLLCFSVFEAEKCICKPTGASLLLVSLCSVRSGRQI